MRNVAYLRVSTADQKNSRQFNSDLSKFDEVFEEKASAKDMKNRPILEECLASLEEGDTLHVHEISRLSRSVDDLRSTVQGLIDKGIGVKFHKEGLEFTADANEPMKTAVSRMVLSTIGAIVEFEREMGSIRTKEALSVKKSQGIKLGAAAEKYRDNPNNPTKRNVKAAVERTSDLVQPIKIIIKTLPKPTPTHIAKALTECNYKLPSGKEGEWKPSQVQRIINRFDINIYA